MPPEQRQRNCASHAKRQEGRRPRKKCLIRRAAPAPFTTPSPRGMRKKTKGNSLFRGGRSVLFTFLFFSFLVCVCMSVCRSVYGLYRQSMAARKEKSVSGVLLWPLRSEHFLLPSPLFSPRSASASQVDRRPIERKPFLGR